MTQSESEQHIAVVRERDIWRERCERAEAEACPHCHGPLEDAPFEARFGGLDLSTPKLPRRPLRKLPKAVTG